jgi:hypothetical protein
MPIDRRRKRKDMKHFALSIWLLFIAACAWGQTYSDANLNGTYSVQFGTPQDYGWSKTLTCPSNSQITYTVNGSTSGTQAGSGTLTFDGAGNVTVVITDIGEQNETASANTTSVTWNSSCQVVSQNDGHIVYESPTTKTQTGAYSVSSNGTGTITVTGSSQSLTLLLAATVGGISNTALLSNPQVNGKSIGTGIAVHQ